MDSELPKRLFVPGSEPEVSHINNYCRLTILDKLESRFENEYKEVKKDPVFSQILTFHDNKLNYSERMIHNILVRQLETDKRHELWFEFARRPLRFSMQEYHAVTGLNFEVDDGGFWSKLLKRQENIILEKIWADYIDGVDDWRRIDGFRLIYLCVIVGVVLARGDKVVIPLEYIKVVMDMTKLREYAWDRVSYDLLLKSVFKSLKKMLKAPKNYVLEGFSYALQIWAMEAIPAVGKLLGTKLTVEFIAGPRCSNWQGSAKVSYDEIKRLEKIITSELPAHGRTRKVWGVDIDRIYFPLNVNGNHWISMCLDIPERKIEVWDCGGHNHQSVDIPERKIDILSTCTSSSS
ncbi:hypothetical protein N665_0049s0023 [Sinapis alba]|nr:hypothetical protein N665_0049s0023 [Sinapis alba]